MPDQHLVDAGYIEATQLVESQQAYGIELIGPFQGNLNPVEHVWNEVREKHFANRQFASMDQLEERLVMGLAVLEADAPHMASLTGFDWITCIPLYVH